MKEFLWKHFVNNYEDHNDPEVRAGYTRLTGTMGILVNTVLCIFKIVLGLIIHSIAVVADGAHDMADSLAAFITLIGARISRKPADEDHPYATALLRTPCLSSCKSTRVSSGWSRDADTCSPQ